MLITYDQFYCLQIKFKSMKTGLRRCLYIGLGGTGINAILHTKKMFMDNYGEVPPMIGFLGIDTDGGIYSKTLDGKEGSKVSLNASEQVSIFTKSTSDIYRENKDEFFTWVSPDNINCLSTEYSSPQQRRVFGRILFLSIMIRLENLLNTL